MRILERMPPHCVIGMLYGPRVERGTGMECCGIEAGEGMRERWATWSATFSVVEGEMVRLKRRTRRGRG